MNYMIVGEGAMGKVLRSVIEERGEEVVLSVSCLDSGKNLENLPAPDALIDFSHPSNINGIYNCVKQWNKPVPVVLATTGYGPEEQKTVEKLAQISPVVQSSNFSQGIRTMKELTGRTYKRLRSCSDCEIIEKHHTKKKDAPSGTALMLANEIDEEIPIHSVRAGTIFGEHEIIFAMEDEVLEIRHTAYSKRIFAIGALEAASYLQGKPVGKYEL